MKSIAPTHRVLVIRVLLCPLLVAGCSGSGSFDLSGTVSYKGKPVPRGSISFAPDSKKGNTGPATGTSIVDGEFRTRPGKAITGGAYKVVVDGYDGVPVKTGEGDMDPNGKPLFTPWETTMEISPGKEPLEIVVPDTHK